MSLSTNFGKYYGIQFAIIGILLFYSLLLTTGVIYLVQNYTLAPDTSPSNVVIQLNLESRQPTSSFNYSYIRLISSNNTLFDLLLSVVGEENLGLLNYGSYGYYIKRIFNATEGSGFFWLYYYRYMNSTTNEFNLVPIGLSNFHLTTHMVIKFIFDNTTIIV